MNPDEISNEDYVVDSDEIMEDATQETNTQNDKDEQEIEKMENLLQEMYETDFMSLQLEEKQTEGFDEGGGGEIFNFPNSVRTKERVAAGWKTMRHQTYVP